MLLSTLIRTMPANRRALRSRVTCRMMSPGRSDSESSITSHVSSSASAPRVTRKRECRKVSFPGNR